MTSPSQIRTLLLTAAGLGFGGPALAQECAADCQKADAVVTAAPTQVHETRVNTFTYSTQHEQALDVADDGRILVAWASRRQEAGSYGVFAQLVDGLGRPLGTELHVNEYLPGAQFQPAVAFAPAGDAWVAWCSQGGQDGDLGGIYLRRLSELDEAQGANRFGPVGGEIAVNQTRPGDQVQPTLMTLADGSLVVCWESHEGEGRRVMARLFDADGTPQGDEFRVGEGVDGLESLPVVAPLADGFAVAFARTAADGKTPAGVFARRFDAAGQAVAAERRLVAGAIEPSLDSDGQGRLALAWMALNEQGDYAPRAQRLDAGLNRIGEVWTAPRPAEGSYANAATVAMDTQGAFVVAYTEHAPSISETPTQKPQQRASILGQRFAADGTALGTVHKLNRFDDGLQDLRVGRNARHVALGAQGQLALAWYGNVNEDGKGIGLTVHAPAAFAPEAPAAIEPVAALEGMRLADLQAQIAPPEWDPTWKDDSHVPAMGPAGPDFGFEAFTSTGWNPPDPDLAVGPNHIVAVVNVDMRFFQKDGTQTFNTGLESWFNTNGFVFDPVALYDETVNRFVVAAVEHEGSGDYFNIAVSDDSDPNGTWYKYRFNVSSICGFIDFPNLGMSRDAYFLIADCFGGGGNFIHIMDKTPMLSGGAVSLNSVNTTSSIISNGASRNYDNEGTLYTASTYAAGSPFIQLMSVENPLGAATLKKYNLNVGSFSNPPDAQQLGTSNRADTIDHRIKNGVKRDGYLYFVHNVAQGGVAKVRWYKIDTNGWPTSGGGPTLVDSGYVDPGSGIYTWFGDVNVDANGNMAIAYNRSSTSEYIGISRTWRAAADAPGTLRDHVELQTSTSPETSSRWGDYSGLEEDPVNPGTFWSHNEYRTSSWRTWIGEFTPQDNTLLLEISLPLETGKTEGVRISGSSPGIAAYLYNGSGLGSTTLPGLGELDIANGKRVLSGTTDAAGTAVMRRFLPASLGGLTVWLQGIDANGETTQVETTTIL